MKCITNAMTILDVGKPGTVVYRVPDEIARYHVASKKWRYVKKSLWKEQNRLYGAALHTGELSRAR